MARKKRQVKQDLRRAGFVEDKDLGKGSHTTWVHPQFPDLYVVIAGHDGDDAKPYDESRTRKMIAEAKRRLGVSYSALRISCHPEERGISSRGRVRTHCVEIPRKLGMTILANGALTATTEEVPMSNVITPQERTEARRYALVIEWSDENDAYLAIAPDLPGLVTDGSTPAEAAAMGEEAVITLLASLRKWGQTVPAPSFSALPADLRPARDLAGVNAAK